MSEQPRESSRNHLTALVGGAAERASALGVLAGAAISLGALNAFPKLWGFQVWDYLPLPAAAAAAMTASILCLRPLRERLLSAFGVFDRPWPAWTVLPGFFAVTLLLLAVRERQLYLGDGRILLYSAIDQPFFFPDVGATWLFHLLARAAKGTGLGSFEATQIGLLLAGAASVMCLAGLARVVTPSAGRAAGFVAIVLGGALLRVLAGHVEVYAFVLLAASAFLWSGAACLAGRARLWVPSLLYGIGLWIHPSFVFLFPSLALLVAARASQNGHILATWIGAGVVAVAPFLLFLLGSLATGGTAELTNAWEASNSIAAAQGGHWLRLPFATPGPSTQWAALSLPHLRFLANSAYLLAPASLPLLIGMMFSGSVAEPARNTTRFLAAAAIGTGVYALVLRPMWGPYDWDLFSLSAWCLSCFAAYLWSRSEASWAPSVGLLAAAAGWLCVALPVLTIGIHATEQAGPLVHEKIPREAGEDPWESIRRAIAPWL